MTIRSNVDGENGVKVWLEFVPAGGLKNFTHVDLEIDADGKRLVAAPLLASRPTAEKVSVHFSADPAYLATSALTIVVEDGALGRSGFRLKVKDFLEPKKSAGAPPVYETAEQIKAMPPCQATVERIETYSALLRTSDGTKFSLGSERGAQEVWHFVGTALKKGESYALPGAFVDFQNRKFYVTADAIKAMPSGKATLEQRGPCSSIFRGADGKQFVIGNPGSGPGVWRFLGTLEEGQAYELPRAFLDYHKR